MDDIKFLRRLCEGYVRYYRRLNLRTDARREDLTGRELNFFADLGERLGFVARYEDQRTDLIWVDIDSGETILRLEREGDAGSVLGDTLPRLFQFVNTRYIGAVLGWVSSADVPLIRQFIEANLAGRLMIVLAWVGSNRDAADKLEAMVFAAEKALTREGKGKVDCDGYWYARFLGPWK